MQLGNWQSRDEEKRLLRIEVETLRRAHARQKEKSDRLQQENTRLKNELKETLTIIVRFEVEVRKLEKQRDRYRDMVFKKNIEPEEPGEEKSVNQAISPPTTKAKKKRGARPGHQGHGRKKPQQVDKIKRVYLTHCPDCGEALPRSNEIHSHTVEDIPAFEEEPRARATRYEQEWQWCGNCRKKVRAQPKGVIPSCRLGINLLLFVLIQKYGAKNSWETIGFNLQVLYGVVVSKGALVAMVHRVRQWLGGNYAALLEEIRGSPVKHADETSWRVNGINSWLWGFFTPKCAYYVVEESRGKGVPQTILGGSHPDDVLVRDDYAAYAKLHLRQQSCWAHLLRKSREAAEDSQASQEVKDLHAVLKTMFASLRELIDKPFQQQEREIAHEYFKKQIADIINANYQYKDSKEIQTRIANQNINLITALLYPNVPLTNNLAERQLRPMVVTRKISGGSRSWEGAKTHAVNMSVFQSLRLQQAPLVPALKNIVLSSSRDFNIPGCPAL